MIHMILGYSVFEAAAAAVGHWVVLGAGGQHHHLGLVVAPSRRQPDMPIHAKNKIADRVIAFVVVLGF